MQVTMSLLGRKIERKITCQTLVIKPIGMNCGKGILIIDSKEEKENVVENLLARYPDGFIMEELIVQAREMGILHPESVNTLRINTVNYGDSVDVKWACVRMGRGGNCVDNAGAGGVFGALDTKTGTILSVSDESHHTFRNHPDTNVPLAGLTIHRWKEACVLCKTAALRLPDCHFIGWDLALTDKGWVVVEANYGPLLIWQIAMGKGVRREFDEMKNKLIN